MPRQDFGLHNALVIKLRAPNTPSGNPQRGWLVYGQDGSFYGFVDEGYLGNAALREAGVRDYVELASIPVAAKVYHAAKKRGAGGGGYFDM